MRALGRSVPLALVCIAELSACRDDGGGGGDALPDIEYCDPVRDWDPNWTSFETQVLTLANQRRSQGADCGTAGTFGPAGNLRMDGALRCAARAHSMNMGMQDDLDHELDGEGPQQRIDATGYRWQTWGENIASGYPQPENVMEGWMSSDGHCGNIMNPDFREIGVGYYLDAELASPYWTQVFGTPAAN